MGTYIYYQQPNPALIDPTNEILHQATLAGEGAILLHVTDVGRVGVKVSGSHMENGKIRQAVVSALATAREKCGLAIDLPSGIEHHLSISEIDTLLPAAERKAQEAQKAADEAKYQENLQGGPR